MVASLLAFYMLILTIKQHVHFITNRLLVGRLELFR